MKLPRLKIPTKELPLVALGISAVLISTMIKIPLVTYILIGIFFGVLSKETRWTYWSAILLIKMFSAFKFLLRRTESDTAILDILWRMGFGMSETLVSGASLNNSSVEYIKDIIVSLDTNPVLSSPVIITIVSAVLSVLGAVLFVVLTVATVAYVIALLPIAAHTVLMLYIFHRNEVVSILESLIIDQDAPPRISRLVVPYIMQGIAIQSLLMTATIPLVFYRILRRIGFYKRIPGIQT